MNEPKTNSLDDYLANNGLLLGQFCEQFNTGNQYISIGTFQRILSTLRGKDDAIPHNTTIKKLADELRVEGAALLAELNAGAAKYRAVQANQ